MTGLRDHAGGMGESIHQMCASTRMLLNISAAKLGTLLQHTCLKLDSRSHILRRKQESAVHADEG